jgi:hypothetical protein
VQFARVVNRELSHYRSGGGHPATYGIYEHYQGRERVLEIRLEFAEVPKLR